MKAYTTRSGQQQYKPSLKALQNIIEGYNDEGFCLACGEHQYEVEPDMVRGTCDGCGAAKVYGAEELAMMGLYHIEDVTSDISAAAFEPTI